MCVCACVCVWEVGPGGFWVGWTVPSGCLRSIVIWTLIPPPPHHLTPSSIRFMEEAPTFVKWLVDKYDDLEFFMVRTNPISCQ